MEQTYRGEQSYIVKDPKTRKYFRFRPVEVVVMQALDGEHTSAEAAPSLAEEGLRVSPAGVEAFAAKLTTMGLCERTLGERSVLQMERLRAERRRRLGTGHVPGRHAPPALVGGRPRQAVRPLAAPVPLLLHPQVPRGVRSRSLPCTSWCLRSSGREFSKALADLYTIQRQPGSLVCLWLTGTVIIVIHELGHGFTCKYFGGQVHEIGAMLIYFEPAFFCNVNDAWTFPELQGAALGYRGRLLDSAGPGQHAAVVWWAATPGTLVSEVALAAVLIGGITTVFMNVNPLIPLDGYYALSDYLEVPNLRQRAFAHLAWLSRPRLLRLDLPQPPADAREQRIFLIYGLCAAAYIALILSFFAATTFGWLTRWLGVGRSASSSWWRFSPCCASRCARASRP